MNPTRAIALLLSISCAFLLGRELARRGGVPEAPGTGYAVQVAAADRAGATLERDAATSVDGATFVEVAEKLRPSVVSIHASSDTSMSAGTGVVLTSDGAILTNHHVIDEMTVIRVTLSSSDHYSAKIVGTDPPSDLAILKIEGVTGLLPATFGDSDVLRVGEDVLAIGNAHNLGWTVTRGIISSLHRSDLPESAEVRMRRAQAGGLKPYTDYIQTDAAINEGNSGGPIVNARGDIVGISLAILDRPSQGIGFAIPANDARFVANELMQRGRVRRGYLGLRGDDLSSPRFSNEVRRRLAPNAIGGLVVSDVEANTPAARSGLQKEDVILSMDGKPVESFEMLRNRIARTPPQTEVSMKVMRGGLERAVQVVIGEFPTEDQ